MVLETSAFSKEEVVEKEDALITDCPTCRERKIQIPDAPANVTHICPKCYAALFNALMKCIEPARITDYMKVIKRAVVPRLSIVSHLDKEKVA